MESQPTCHFGSRWNRNLLATLGRDRIATYLLFRVAMESQFTCQFGSQWNRNLLIEVSEQRGRQALRQEQEPRQREPVLEPSSWRRWRTPANNGRP